MPNLMHFFKTKMIIIRVCTVLFLNQITRVESKLVNVTAFSIIPFIEIRVIWCILLIQI